MSYVSIMRDCNGDDLIIIMYIPLGGICTAPTYISFSFHATTNMKYSE